ncbi:hypothetical protein RhiirB3_455746 [Rhizophagus irregularis]|nr:hypothetical protein RhiirB3_455746 [Rhizophagus irregularis]
MKSMRNLRSKRKINDQQDIEAIIDGFEVNMNSTPNNGKKKWKTTTQKVKSLVTKPTINKTSVGNNSRPSTSNDTTLSNDNLSPFTLNVTPITALTNVPITIEDKSNNIFRLPLIDIENSSQILTNATNQNSDVIESQMKKLFDLHKQIRKLECVIEGKKKTEWWEQYVEDGVKEIINECLYLKEESLSLLYRNFKFSSDIISISFQYHFNINLISIRYQNKVLSL